MARLLLIFLSIPLSAAKLAASLASSSHSPHTSMMPSDPDDPSGKGDDDTRGQRGAVG